jgi:hypothetical protein
MLPRESAERAASAGGGAGCVRTRAGGSGAGRGEGERGRTAEGSGEGGRGGSVKMNRMTATFNLHCLAAAVAVRSGRLRCRLPPPQGIPPHGGGMPGSGAAAAALRRRQWCTRCPRGARVSRRADARELLNGTEKDENGGWKRFVFVEDGIERL